MVIPCFMIVPLVIYHIMIVDLEQFNCSRFHVPSFFASRSIVPIDFSYILHHLQEWGLCMLFLSYDQNDVIQLYDKCQSYISWLYQFESFWSWSCCILLQNRIWPEAISMFLLSFCSALFNGRFQVSQLQFMLMII